MRILATDVGYDEDKNTALAAGVVFSHWEAEKPLAEYAIPIQGIAPYEPGSFYKRELPCLQALLEAVREQVDIILIDGYVDTSPGHAGLGRHLFDTIWHQHNEFFGKSPSAPVTIIGVAKTHFAGCDAHEVTRGESKKPLFVTAAGTSSSLAAEYIRRMRGPHRIPTLLKRADEISRGR